MTILEQSGAAPQAAAGLIKETTTQSFVKDVIEESKIQPVLIDFWAPWCGPCRTLTPIIEKAVTAAKGKVKLVKMNIDEYPEIPGQMGIQSIPAVIAFVNGQPADGFMGAVPESGHRLHRQADGGHARRGTHRRRTAAGSRSHSGGGRSGHRRLDLWRDHRGRRGLGASVGRLARCYVETGALEQARQTLELVPAAQREDAAVKAVQAKIDLIDQASALGPVTELEQKSPPIRSTTVRVSILPSRSTRPTNATRRSAICWKSSSVTASGTTTAPASS